MDWEAAKELLKKQTNHALVKSVRDTIPITSAKVKVNSSIEEVPNDKVKSKRNEKKPKARLFIDKGNNALSSRKPTGFIKIVGEFAKQEGTGHPKIEIQSKRATYSFDYNRCRNCYSEKAHWHYAESNIGPVFLCSACKNKLFQKSKGGKSDTIFIVVNRNKKV